MQYYMSSSDLHTDTPRAAIGHSSEPLIKAAIGWRRPIINILQIVASNTMENLLLSAVQRKPNQLVVTVINQWSIYCTISGDYMYTEDFDDEMCEYTKSVKQIAE